MAWVPQHITSAGACFQLVPRIRGESLNHLLRWHSPASSRAKTLPSVKGKKGYIICKTNCKVSVGPLFKNDEEIQEKQQDIRLSMGSS